MRTSFMALALVAALAAPLAEACGICIEDRVAAVFDNGVVDRAVAAKRHVAFFSIDGALPATAESRRAILAALYASGAVKGSVRVSLESASASAVFNPARLPLDSFASAASRRLAAAGLALSPLRVVDASGVLQEPVAVR
jgi:hypothetical protein